MADSKVSALTAKTAPVRADEVYLVDNDASPASKKVTVDDLIDVLPEVVPQTGTELKTYLESSGDLIIRLDPAVGDYSIPGSTITSDLTDGTKVLLANHGQTVTGVATTIGNFTWTASSGNAAQASHGLTQDERIRVTSVGASGLTVNGIYWVNVVDTGNITLASTRGGAAITSGSDTTITCSNFWNVMWRLTGAVSGGGKWGIYIENLSLRGDMIWTNANYCWVTNLQQTFGVIEIRNRSTNGWSEFLDIQGHQANLEDSDIGLTFDRDYGGGDQGQPSFKGCRVMLDQSGGGSSLLVKEDCNIYNGHLDLSVWNPQTARPIWDWQDPHDERCQNTTVNFHVENVGNATYGLYIDNASAVSAVLISGVVDSGVDRYAGAGYFIADGYASEVNYLPRLVDIDGISIWGVRAPDAAMTLTAADTIVNVDASSAFTITLPDPTLHDGVRYLIRRNGGNTVTIDSGTDTYSDTGAATDRTLDTDGASIDLFSDGTTVWQVVGTNGTVG